MEVRTFTNGEDLRRYNEWVHSHPQGTLWQSLEWKRYQESLGRSVRIYIAEEAGIIVASAMVVIDRTRNGYSTWEMPRGPLTKCESTKVSKYESGKYESAKVQTVNVVSMLMEKILDDAKRERCIVLYLSPIESLSTYELTYFRTSLRHVQPQTTRILDLTPSEEQLLAGMHQKARYNIKVAQKHGVTILKHHADDQKALDSLYTLLRETAGRDGFRHLPKSHYEAFLKHLEGSFFLLAWHNGDPVAGLLGVIWKDIGFYYYGASSYKHRHLMAPYLLQWEAMLHCKKAGCTRYDLLGISHEGAKSDDPWAGITDFKRKFGGTVVNYPQEQMVVLRPIVKKVLEWKRGILG